MAGKLRVEGWTLPSTGTFKRKFFHVPVVGGTGRRELSAWHSVSLDIPRSWSRLPDLLSGTLLRVYDGSKVVDEFVAERMPQELRTDSTVTVTGPQIAGLTQRIGIYPPDYPQNPPRRPNWIWNGKNIAAPLDLEDLRHINSEWIIYLERERYGFSIINATKGQIRFTYDGDTSDPVSRNPSANAVKEAIEGLDGINEVYVLKHEDESFTIVILNPTKLVGDLAVEAVPDSDFDGSLDFDKHAEGFDSSSNPTFTITVTTVDGSETTGNLPWNASTFAIEQALEGLGNVRDVTVQGSGHFGDPWEIVFYVPPQVDNMQVSFAAGSEVIRETVEGRLDPSPVTQSMFADQRIDEFIHGTYGDPPIEVVTDSGLLDDGAEWAIKVNAQSQFAGSQRVLAAIPGEIYQAKIRVRPTVSGRYRLVIRETLEDNLIKWHTPNEVWLEADGNYHDLVVPDITIPAGVTEVIMRVAVVSAAPSEIGPFYVNWQHAEFVQGLAPATAGQIVKTLLEQAQERGAGTWLDLSFDGEEDTDGTAWPMVHSYQADGFAMYLSDVLADMADLGYEWTVTPKASPSNGYTHDLNLWVSGGAGEDRTTTGPTLTSGGSVVGGEIVKRIPAFTAGVVWGADDLFAERTDTDLASTFGRLERFFDAEQHHDTDSLEDMLETMFSDEETNRQAGNVELSGSGSVVPFVHFDVGDTLVWQVPPAMERNDRRVQTISWQHGPVAKYEVQGSRVWGEASPLEAIIRLLDAPKKRRRIHPPNPTQFGGGGGIPDVVVAASNTKFKEDADLVCDTLGQDQVTINQALERLSSAGGWVHLLEGTYTVTGPIVMPGKNVKLTGAGRDITVIRPADGSSMSAVISVAPSSRHYTFEDFTIHGNKENATVSVALISSAQGLAAQRNSISLVRLKLVGGSDSGVRGGRDWCQWSLQDVSASGMGGSGFSFSECEVFANAVRSVSNGRFGWFCSYGGVQIITNSIIQGNGNSGFGNGGLTGANAALIIHGSRIHDNAGHGIDAVHAGIEVPIVVVANRITNNSGRSVLANSASVVLANYIEGNGIDTPIPDQGNILGGSWSGGGGGADLDGTADAITFSTQPGEELAAGQGSFRFVAPRAGTLVGVTAAVGDPPTGDDVIVDVNKNGVTVFTTQANRPTVGDGANNGTAATPDVSAIAAGDWFTVDVDQVGSTFGGADLTVTLHILWELEESA